MEHIEYFKLQAKNLHKDFKTRFFNEEQKTYDYHPKFFDIGKIFIEFDIPDYKDDFSFSLMNAQHVIAKIAKVNNWKELVALSKEEQRLAHRRLDLSEDKLRTVFAQTHEKRLQKALYAMPNINTIPSFDASKGAKQ